MNCPFSRVCAGESVEGTQGDFPVGRDRDLRGQTPAARTLSTRPIPTWLRGVPIVGPNPRSGARISATSGWHMAGGDHRLVLAPGARSANQQRHGSGIPCRLPGGGPAHSRQAGNLQRKIKTHNSPATPSLASLRREGVVIGMDGRGRAFDNIFVERLRRSVKHEDVYLNGYASMGELMVGPAKYFAFYNGGASAPVVGSKDDRCRVSDRSMSDGKDQS